MMQEHMPKGVERVTKVREIKIKGPFKPYSPLLVPGCALFWGTNLEMLPKS